MTPSPVAPEVYEIYDISYSHTNYPKEYIQTSIAEEKLSFHPTQSFSNDSSILNYVQSLPVKAQGAKEKFDSSLSNHVVGVRKVILWMFWKKYHISEVIHFPLLV